jgi:hypothetical protein
MGSGHKNWENKRMISASEFQYLCSAQPEGYTVVPLVDKQVSGALRIGAMLKKEPDPVGGSLILLRDNLDARVYLGCVIDADQRVQQWVEIWVQTVAGLLGTPASFRQAVSNAILDERWIRFADALTSLGMDGIVRVGWETRHPLPAFIRTKDGVLVNPTGSLGTPWRLCEDDALLEQHGLPPYRSTLHRYLYLAGGEDRPTVFAPVTPEAPMSAHAVPCAQVTAADPALAPLNPEGGFVIVRPFYPLGYNEYLDVLNGGSWKGLAHGLETPDFQAMVRRLGHPDNPGRIFMGGRGLGGQLIEILHLKLCVLADAIRATQTIARVLQKPLLNLSADSFRVQLADIGAALPYLWTARVTLVDPGEAVALPIQTTDVRYYVRGKSQNVSIYLPESVVVFARGRCGIRIRQIFSDVRKGVIVEGTFQTRDDIVIHKHDLVWFRVNLPSGPTDIYAHLEEDRALAYGEWRFRSVGQTVDVRFAEALKAAAGVPLHNTPYEVLPLLSTPCDLYALAVLAVKTLLVDGRNSLPMALDEVLSLAREAEANEVVGEDLSARIAALFERDIRWGESLGPQRLVQREMTSANAFAAIPLAVWLDTLAMLVRMLPGVSRFSSCRDWGDAPPRALHEVMNRSIKDLDRLILQTRGLIVTDWDENREIRLVLDEYKNSMKKLVT